MPQSLPDDPGTGEDWLGAHQAKLLTGETYNKNICQRKEKQQYIAVGTLRMSVEVAGG